MQGWEARYGDRSIESSPPAAVSACRGGLDASDAALIIARMRNSGSEPLERMQGSTPPRAGSAFAFALAIAAALPKTSVLNFAFLTTIYPAA